jgi:hypothetical protein
VGLGILNHVVQYLTHRLATMQGEASARAALPVAFTPSSISFRCDSIDSAILRPSAAQMTRPESVKRPAIAVTIIQGGVIVIFLTACEIAALLRSNRVRRKSRHDFAALPPAFQSQCFRATERSTYVSTRSRSLRTQIAEEVVWISVWRTEWSACVPRGSNWLPTIFHSCRTINIY